MVKYSLSKEAANDLKKIAHYTVKYFGKKQARLYRNGFKVCFKNIVDNPSIGRSFEHIRPHLRCLDHKSHSVYYLPQNNRILIIRVLHNRQDYVLAGLS